MKLLLFLMLLLSLYSYGQQSKDYNPYAIGNAFNKFNKEDSLDGLFTDISRLKIISDTIPAFTEKDDVWKDAKYIHFFFDSTNILKRVLYRNGRNETCYFYYDEMYIKKVRGFKHSTATKSTYYFTTKDNEFTASQIGQRITTEPEKKEFYELLEISRNFYYRFKTYL